MTRRMSVALSASNHPSPHPKEGPSWQKAQGRASPPPLLPPRYRERGTPPILLRKKERRRTSSEGSRKHLGWSVGCPTLQDCQSLPLYQRQQDPQPQAPPGGPPGQQEHLGPPPPPLMLQVSLRPPGGVPEQLGLHSRLRPPGGAPEQHLLPGPLPTHQKSSQRCHPPQWSQGGAGESAPGHAVL